MRLYRLYERRDTSTWNFYAVVGVEAQRVPAQDVESQSIKLVARCLALTPFAPKGEPCTRNNNTPIDNFSAMNWSYFAASASLAAAHRRACRFFDVPGSPALTRRGPRRGS
jgi:hypothetical protein